MSLTWKLIAGFLFALVLQVTQMLTSSYFTSRMLDASVGVSDALAACLSVQAGIDAARALTVRVKDERSGGVRLDQAVGLVFVEEVQLQASRIARVTTRGDIRVWHALQTKLVTLQTHLEALARTDLGRAEERQDALAFFEEEVGEVEQALLRAQASIRAVALADVEIERSVHDLPWRASVVITLIGIVLMAVFVAWYSR